MSDFRFRPDDFDCPCEQYPCAHTSTEWIATRANALWRAKISKLEARTARAPWGRVEWLVVAGIVVSVVGLIFRCSK